MRTLTISFAAFCGFATVVLCASPAYAAPRAMPSVGNDARNDARQKYALIERNLKNYARIETDLPVLSTQGGILTAYLHRRLPRKITAHAFGEIGNTQTDFYFWNGRLFFVLQTREQYDKPLYTAYEEKTEVGKVVHRLQDRMYFREGKLVRWTNQSGKTVNDSKMLQQQESETLSAARLYLAHVNKLHR